MRSSISRTAAALVVIASATLGAQDRPQRQPQPRMPMPGGAAPGAMAEHMPMPGGPPAAHVLMMRGELALSDDQAKRLEALVAPQRSALEPNPGAMLRAAADLADAMKGDGNLDAARAAMDKMARIGIDRAIAHLKAMQETRAVLNAEQRDKVKGMMQMMIREQMGAAGRGMMGGGAGGMMGRGGRGMMQPGGPGMRSPGGPPPDGDARP